MIEFERPHVGTAHHIGKQRRATLADNRWMQRDPSIRQVKGLPTRPGLGVDGATGRDKCRHIGDRVPDAVPRARFGKAHRLVKVERFRRVECEKIEVEKVRVGETHRGHRGMRLGLNLRRKFGRETEVVADGGQRGSERAIRRAEPHRREGHQSFSMACRRTSRLETGRQEKIMRSFLWHGGERADVREGD